MERGLSASFHPFFVAPQGHLALVPASNVVCALAFAGGTQFNFVAGWACAILSTVVAAVVTYLFGFEKDSEAFVEDAE